jgi:hypothetical protein
MLMSIILSFLPLIVLRNHTMGINVMAFFLCRSTKKYKKFASYYILYSILPLASSFFPGTRQSARANTPTGWRFMSTAITAAPLSPRPPTHHHHHRSSHTPSSCGKKCAGCSWRVGSHLTKQQWNENKQEESNHTVRTQEGNTTTNIQDIISFRSVGRKMSNNLTSNTDLSTSADVESLLRVKAATASTIRNHYSKTTSECWSTTDSACGVQGGVQWQSEDDNDNNNNQENSSEEGEEETLSQLQGEGGYEEDKVSLVEGLVADASAATSCSQNQASGSNKRRRCSAAYTSTAPPRTTSTTPTSSSNRQNYHCQKKKELNAQQRQVRNAREQERSNKISHQYATLRQLLNDAGIVVPKGTKGCVLSATREYIAVLQQRATKAEL